jgi:hypothetical protein
MQTRSSRQHRPHSESSENPLAMTIKPRPWGEAPQAQLPQAVQRQPGPYSWRDMFSYDPVPSLLRAKLTVGAPNDVYEQEADRVAEQVMSMPDTKPAVQREGMPEEEEDLQAKPLGGSIQREAMPEEEEEIQAKPLSATITPLVQREVMPEEEEEIQAKALGGSIQREAMPEEEEEPIQAKLIQREAMPEEEEEIQMKRSSGGGFEAGGDFESRLSSSQGGGSPLPNDVRSFMEPRLGADFSQVRVHTGSDAIQMNRGLNAQAFTHKQDVYFGAGKTPRTDALTAHELTHVVQQTGVVQRKCAVCNTIGKNSEEEPQIHRKLNTLQVEHQVNMPLIQRIHTENGRKKFDNDDYIGDSKLEACLNNEDRLKPLESGSSVTAVQQGLQKDGADLGEDKKGFYGAATGKAVEEFKKKYGLGFTQFPDVGPGTMRKLDELGSQNPPPVSPPISQAPIKTIKVWLNAFIPKDVPGRSFPATGSHTGQTMLKGPVPLVSDCFLTDQRSFSSIINAPSRLHSEVEIDISTPQQPKIASQSNMCSTTFEIDCEDGDDECVKVGTVNGGYSNLQLGTSPSRYVINLQASSSNPCFIGSPSVNYKGQITIDAINRVVGFAGFIDGFPAYEMYANADGGSGNTLFMTPPPPGNGPENLFGDANRPQFGVAGI